MNTLPSLDNVVSINNPEIILHAHYFRLVRLLAVNIEIYKQLRRTIPSFLHIRDYVAAVQKLLVKFTHTPEFYEEWMNINMVYYQMINPNPVLNNLFIINSELIGNLKKLKESQFYNTFPAPNFSIYNDPYGTLSTGNLPGLGHVSVIHKSTDKPYKKTPYGVESLLSNSIHANEITEIMRNIHRSKGLVVGGARRKSKSREDKYEGIIDSLLYPQLNGTMYYVQPNDLATKVAKLNAMFRGLVGNYCTSKGINPRDVKCLDASTELFEKMQKNVCANGNLSSCLDDISNGAKNLIAHADAAVVQPHEASLARIKELEKLNSTLTDENDKMHSQLDSAKTKLDEAAIVLTKTQTELDDVVAKIKLNTETKEKTAENLAELALLKKQLDDKTTETEDAQTRLTSCQIEINELLNQIEEAKAAKDKITTELETTKVMHTQQIGEITKNLTVKIDKLKTELESAKTSSLAEKIALEAQIAGINAELASLKASSGTDKRELALAKAKVEGNLATTQAELKNAQELSTANQQKIKDLKERLANLQESMDNMMKGNLELKENLDVSTANNTDLSARLTLSTDTNKDLTNQLTLTRTTIDSIKAELSKLQDIRNDSIKKIKELEEKILVCQSTSNTLAEKEIIIIGLNASNDELKRQLQALQNNSSSVDESARLNEKISENEDKIRELLGINQNLIDQIKQLKVSIHGKEQLDNDNEQLKERINSLEMLGRSGVAELVRVKKQHNDCKAQIKDLTDKIVRLTETIAAATTKDGKTREALNKMTAENINNANTIAGLNSYIRDLETSLTNSNIPSIDARIKDLETQIGANDAVMKKYEQTIKSLEDQIAELNETNVSEIKKLSNENADLTETIVNLEKRIETDESIIKTLNTQLNQITDDKNFYKNSIEEATEKDLQNKNRILKIENNVLEKRIKNLNDDLADAKKQLSDSTTKLNAEITRIDALLNITKDTLSACTDNNQRLEAKNKELTDDLLNVKTTMTTKLDEFLNYLTTDLDETKNKLIEIENVAKTAIAVSEAAPSEAAPSEAAPSEAAPSEEAPSEEAPSEAAQN